MLYPKIYGCTLCFGLGFGSIQIIGLRTVIKPLGGLKTCGAVGLLIRSIHCDLLVHGWSIIL